MEKELNNLLGNLELVEKIIFHYELHNKKTSHIFLMHKFKVNSSMAARIMKVVTLYEKENGIEHKLLYRKKNIQNEEKKDEEPDTYIRNYVTQVNKGNCW